MYSQLKGYVSRKYRGKADESDDADAEEGTSGYLVSFRGIGSKLSSTVGAYLTWSSVQGLSEDLKTKHDIQSIDDVENERTDDQIQPSCDETFTSTRTGADNIRGTEYKKTDDGKKMKKKSVPEKPEGTVEYTVEDNDTLAKIALKYDTTPTELKRLNKLSSHMIFPGQSLFVPHQVALPGPSADTNQDGDHAITKPPPPYFVPGTSPDSKSDNADHHKLSKSLSGGESDDGDWLQERYLKIKTKLITDGQGVVSGVLLLTPQSVMFNPNVSDPLVMERGRDSYIINTPLTAITSAAMYKDIATMAMHNPLKRGRFHVDTETAELLVRQNSVDTESSQSLASPPMSPKEVFSPRLETSSPINSSKEFDSHISDTQSKLSNDDSSQGRAMPDDITGSKDTTLTDGDEDNIDIIVQDILDQVIDSITGCKKCEQNDVETGRNLSHHISNNAKSINKSRNKDNKDKILNGSENSPGDLQCTLDVDDTNGIFKCKDEGFILLHGQSSSNSLSSKLQTPFNKDSTVCDKSGQSQINNRFVKVDSQASLESLEKEVSLDSGIDQSPAKVIEGRYFDRVSSLSREVLFWLGRTGAESPSELEDEILPRPAATSSDLPVYICLKISKRNWMYLPNVRHHGRPKNMRREHWFAIPHSKCEKLHRYLRLWSPNINNETVDEEDEFNNVLSSPEPEEDGGPTWEDDMCEEAEEGIRIVENFFSNTPPDNRKLLLYKDREVADETNGDWVWHHAPVRLKTEGSEEPETKGKSSSKSLENLKQEGESSVDGAEQEKHKRGEWVWKHIVRSENKNGSKSQTRKKNKKAKRNNETSEEASTDSSISELEIDTLPEMIQKSEILTEDQIRALSQYLPSRTIGHCWMLSYSTFEHGISLSTMYRKMEVIDSPVLLVVVDNNSQVFGVLTSDPLRISDVFFGTGESFLFKFSPELKVFSWTGDNHFFMKGDLDSIAFGGGTGNFGLWLDGDFYRGCTHPCQTYNNERLTEEEDFIIRGLEAWTFT